MADCTEVKDRSSEGKDMKLEHNCKWGDNGSSDAHMLERWQLAQSLSAAGRHVAERISGLHQSWRQVQLQRRPELQEEESAAKHIAGR